jgi:hypothetical protein
MLADGAAAAAPLIRVESGGMKKIRRRRGITPLKVLKCGHIEMQKNAEAQFYKPLLQIEKWPSRSRGRALCLLTNRGGNEMATQHRNSRSLCGQTVIPWSELEASVDSGRLGAQQACGSSPGQSARSHSLHF